MNRHSYLSHPFTLTNGNSNDFLFLSTKSRRIEFSGSAKLYLIRRELNSRHLALIHPSQFTVRIAVTSYQDAKDSSFMVNYVTSCCGSVGVRADNGLSNHISEDMYQCYQCGNMFTFPLAYFHNDGRTLSTLITWCRNFTNDILRAQIIGGEVDLAIQQITDQITNLNIE